ncbi:MAG: S-layer family protein, partial [Moorea sp. SIO3C2]|nr:S-layer family protein [Moorena sp. SIO3C2]
DPFEFVTREIPSIITTAVGNPGTGNAGEIRIDTDHLQLTTGGLISTSSLGDGPGGDVTIMAQDTVELTGTSADGVFPSGIYSRAAGGNGSGGNISLNTPNLLIQDAATVDVSNFDRFGTETPGTGPAGNITIESDTIQLLNRASLNADTLNGQQGNITVLADTLTLDNASRISSNAAGAGHGGNLDVTANNLRLLNKSQFVANAAGEAGNIVVNTPQSLYLNNSQITASGGQGNLSFISPIVLLRNGSLVATDARGTAIGGNITIDTDFLIALENSDITANAEESFGGQILVNAQKLIGTDYRLQLTPKSDITASSELGPDLQGTVALNTLDVDLAQGLSVLTEEFENNETVATSCADTSITNSLVISGRGGIPVEFDSTQSLLLHTPWNNIRQLSNIDNHRYRLSITQAQQIFSQLLL